MQTTFGVNELAERWGISSGAVRAMERNGKLHRLPQIPGVRFSAAEVFELENIGKEINPLTPWERKRLEKENNELRARLEEYERRFTKIMTVVRGGAI